MWRDGTGAAFAVVEAATDRLLGAVTRFGPEEHTSTFGCWVAPDARGRAVGRRALGLLADWTFATTSTVRIDGYIMVGNDTSERMVERLGWQREGVLRAWHVRPRRDPGRLRGLLAASNRPSAGARRACALEVIRVD